MDKKLHIISVAGHGGADTGGIYSGFYEKNFTLRDSQIFAEMMEDEYPTIPVTRIRTDDITLAPNERIEMIDSIISEIQSHNRGANILILDHHYNASYSELANGAEIIHGYYNKGDDVLAREILNEWEELGYRRRSAYSKLNDRSEEYYYMERHFQQDKDGDGDYEVTCLILEPGFITNANDRDMMLRGEFVANRIQATIRAIGEHYKLDEDYSNHWGKDNIEYCVENKLMNGYADGTFKPDQQPTRAELATVVANLHRELSRNG